MSTPMNERVSVTIEKKCLQRLLDTQQLSVVEFHCTDRTSKYWLKSLLLSLTVKRLNHTPNV
ncbi:hypothetical protein [Teredinibacter purpureus]|jgi:hypothetical protein|uniref:hypothetical protein n=1 Tax=Teredinibacter purpureus TaxID=2731756 RepID=UPI0013C4C81F|nr:hypothetical protein [Teredinibacter purpureus]